MRRMIKKTLSRSFCWMRFLSGKKAGSKVVSKAKGDKIVAHLKGTVTKVIPI